MAEIVKIKKDGVTQYPITKPEAVIDEDGKTIKDRISDLESKLEDSDFYIIESFNLIWLYDTFVWADGDRKDIAAIQFKTDEGPAIWDSIRAGKKIAVKMGDDTVHGYGLAITSYTDDVSYLTFQYEDVGCFSFGIDGMGDVGGYFYRSVTANNLETFLAKSPKIAELSAEIGKKQDTITDLAAIRSGAAKGATALQSVPDTYATKTYVDEAIAAEIDNALTEEY
jgi:hypothetical protein